jgi:hypothetical protein
MNKDIYQKIASLSDDTTALGILAINREMNKVLLIFRFHVNFSNINV